MKFDIHKKEREGWQGKCELPLVSKVNKWLYCNWNLKYTKINKKNIYVKMVKVKRIVGHSRLKIRMFFRVHAERELPSLSRLAHVGPDL